MDQQFKMTKQIIDMQKASAEGVINGLTMMWEQTAILVDSASWLPEEGRKQFKQWVEINKRACEGFKSAIENGYSNLERAVGWRTKPQQEAA
jgi:hypothetical protein